MFSILFVCTANICRSPMAMGLWRHMVSDRADEWIIESAGTWAPEGEPAANKTQLVLRELNINLRDHASRQVTREMLANFNLILVMERGHKEALQIEFPQIADRVYLLSEMIEDEFEIKDPIGMSTTDFIKTRDEIFQLLTTGSEKITRLASDR
jgi:glycine hydroxymethyltransferase